MHAYLVKRLIPVIEWNKRVGLYHSDVFHGVVEHDDRDDPNSAPLLRLSRSGRFVPDCFAPGIDFVVSEKVKERLEPLNVCTFESVVFDRLVDLEMPAVGEAVFLEADATGKDLIREMPDVKALHDSIGPYFAMNCVRTRELKGKYPDAKEIDVGWGTYRSPLKNMFTRSVSLSAPMLSEHGIIRGGCYIFREDAFAAVAPFLACDYFGVAVVRIIEDEERERRYQEHVHAVKEGILRQARSAGKTEQPPDPKE